MKAISPLLSEVLLILIVVSIASIFSLWMVNYSKTQTFLIENQSSKKVECSNANLAVYKPYFCNNYLSFYLRNTGLVKLKGISVVVIYPNGDIQQKGICSSNDSFFLCEKSNITVYPSEEIFLNFSTSTFSKVKVFSLECPTVYDILLYSETSTC